jgi:uncharacterized protein YggE
VPARCSTPPPASPETPYECSRSPSAQARSQAVNQAKAQAAQLAKAAGVTLGRIRSITELADPGYPISYDMRAAAGASESSVPLQAGQQELTISVDIVYDIS